MPDVPFPMSHQNLSTPLGDILGLGLGQLPLVVSDQAWNAEQACVIGWQTEASRTGWSSSAAPNRVSLLPVAISERVSVTARGWGFPYLAGTTSL